MLKVENKTHNRAFNNDGQERPNSMWIASLIPLYLGNKDRIGHGLLFLENLRGTSLNQD